MSISGGSTKIEPWEKAKQPILNANAAVAGTYGANAGKIQGYADQIGGLIPSMIDKYNAGDPSVNAAQSWVQRMLSGDGSNPNLQGMIDMAGQDTERSITAGLGTRGNIGGSVQQRILASELTKQGLGLRYNDWIGGQQRQAQAAQMAPGLASADMMQINPILAAAGSASGLPMDAAAQYAGATGGLLGQYTTTKQSQPWGGALLGGIAGGLGAYFGQKGR